MEIGLRKQGKTFIAYDMETKKDLSLQYNDEKHVLRWAKLKLNWKGTPETVPIFRDWEKVDEPPVEVNEDFTLQELDEMQIPEPNIDYIQPQDETLSTEIEGPNESRVPEDYEYYCEKCSKIHRKESKIGKRHLKEVANV